jgi:hypothetical protein
MSIVKTLETQIIGILDGVSALQKNWDHEPKKLGALPCSTLLFTGFAQEGVERMSTETTYKWAMKLYFDLNDAKTAQDQIKTVLPDVLSAFRTNPGLNGNCIYSIVASGEVYFLLDRDNTLAVVEMELSATREEDN